MRHAVDTGDSSDGSGRWEMIYAVAIISFLAGVLTMAILATGRVSDD
jgi:ABC-type phosphate transport system permease subunit